MHVRDRSGLVVLLLAAAVAGCRLHDPGPAPGSGTGSPRPLEVSAERPLEPGRWAQDGFLPRVAFEVGAGWYAVQSVPGFFDVQRDPGSPDVVAVQFARPAGPRTAEEALAELHAREGLVVGAPRTVRVAGLPGTEVVVDAADPDLGAGRFVEALRVPPGPISLASGRRLRITFVDTDAGLLAVLVGGSVRGWDAAVRAAEPVVRSIRIDPSGVPARVPPPG